MFLNIQALPFHFGLQNMDRRATLEKWIPIPASPRALMRVVYALA